MWKLPTRSSGKFQVLSHRGHPRLIITLTEMEKWLGDAQLKNTIKQSNTDEKVQIIMSADNTPISFKY